MSDKQFYVYILANSTNVALYIGVTNNLLRRIYEHKEKLVNGFAEKYDINKLVYYEIFEDPENAITREKLLKGTNRAKKNQLITDFNPEWMDLYPDL